MKKLVTSLTALAFVLGLSAAGYSQTAGKEPEKPGVKMEAPATQPTVAPKEAAKPGETAKPVTKETKTGKEAVKGGEKGKKEAKKAGKIEKKSALPVEKGKEEKK
jgi:hypothetical protein